MWTRRLASILGLAVILLMVRTAICEPEGEDFDDRMAAGQRLFREASDFAAAQQAFESAAALPDLDREQRASAEFWAWACVSRRGNHEAAVRSSERWLARWPDQPRASYVRYFLARSLIALGRTKEAEHQRATILLVDPKGRMAELVRRVAGGDSQPARTSAAAPEGSVTTRSVTLQPTSSGRGPYVVLRLLGDAPAAGDARTGRSGGFSAVAERIAQHHGARLLVRRLADLDAILTELKELRPAHLLIVVEPQDLDLALHRRMLMGLTRLDADPFVDVRFGYFTARTAPGLAALWERTLRMHREGLSSRTWLATAVTGAAKSIANTNIPDAPARAGFTGSRLYFAMPAKDAEAAAFLDEHWPRFEKAGVISMTGCGDPEGIWLFDDHRNGERDKHWDFDPAKVGQDPRGEMPRIRAERFRSLMLDGPVVWTGTCHSGATGPVFVEGDIVSTFGRTEQVTRYEMPPERSLALAVLEAGATAYLCPLGANHGMSVSREIEVAFERGASLGDTIKSTYDDLCRSVDGDLALTIPIPGAHHRRTEYIMVGGGANRILIGDPRLSPFPKGPANPKEQVHVTAVEGGLDVEVRWAPGFHPHGWNMFGSDRSRDGQVPLRVPLPDGWAVDSSEPLAIELEAKDSHGAVLPFHLRSVRVEDDLGTRFLHLKATVPRSTVRRASLVLRYRIRRP